MPNINAVVPTKLSLNTKFRFRCHKAIKCFTRCCSKIDILLTPYDIIRMKNRLGLTSDEFLSRYTYVKVDKKSSHPHVLLKMSDGKDSKCPFVTPKGCTIYSDRPANCRYYPIGQGTVKKQGKNGHEEEEFYFYIKEPHCLGYQEDKEWTIESWRIDQGVDLYDRMNSEWKGIHLRRNIPGQTELDDKKQAMFYIASYDIDNFRRFVFESNFLNLFEIDDEVIRKIRDDEVELMKFGFSYIRYILMLDKTLKVKNDVLKDRKRKA